MNAPENLEISINNDGRTLNVSWGAVSDSEGYMIRLYKKTDNEESDDIMTDTKMINNAAQTECEFVLSATVRQATRAKPLQVLIMSIILLLKNLTYRRV